MTVSIITPTTHDRQAFNARIADIAQRQEYPILEHLFDYGPERIGSKLNRLCSLAKGDVIARFDSDDRYACDWITQAIQAINDNPGYDIYGLKDLYYTGGWKYTGGQSNKIVWGGTMFFRKSFWEHNMFADISRGEDSDYCRKGKVFSMDYADGVLCTLHEGNTCEKKTTSSRWSCVIREAALRHNAQGTA